MQLASQVYHIETAANGLCFFRDGEAAYLCRRFDVGPNGWKYQQEDFASLAGLSNANGGSDFKYSNLSYEECADIIRKYVKAAPVEIMKFFRIVVFNYLTLNDDAHLKNFSLIKGDDGEYRLAPAYDLINTSLHLRLPRIFALDKGLFKEGMKLSDTRTQLAAQKLFPGCAVKASAYVPGALPVYELTLETADRGEVDLSLTEQGGKLLSFLASPAGDKNDPPSDEESERLREAALAFLQELGVEDPAAAYAQYYQGVTVLNFAPRQDGVILYSDLVKVYMDRETGDVMGVDARNYRLNHRTRALPKPRITEQQAAEYVSDSLQVELTALALIPLTKQTEVLCYEFKATQNDTFYIVYINALTGEEEQIFEVINSQEGDLVV